MEWGDGLALCDACVSPLFVEKQSAYRLSHGRPVALRKPADAAVPKQLRGVALLRNDRRRSGQQLEQTSLRVHPVGYVDIQGYSALVDQLVTVRSRDAGDQPFPPDPPSQGAERRSSPAVDPADGDNVVLFLRVAGVVCPRIKPARDPVGPFGRYAALFHH